MHVKLIFFIVIFDKLDSQVTSNSFSTLPSKNWRNLPRRPVISTEKEQQFTSTENFNSLKIILYCNEKNNLSTSLVGETFHLVAQECGIHLLQAFFFQERER